MVASDKLFVWLYQDRTERLQPLVASLLPEMEGYTFTAPAIKEREVRLDGLFLPPTEQLDAKTALIMEAQMAPDPEFFLRLYNEGSLLLRHQYRQGQPVRYWRVLVICPSRDLNFGDPVPVAEFLRERVHWIELAPERMPPSAAIRQQAAATAMADEMDDVIAAILLSRFNGRSITEICAMGGITIDDFTSSVAYKEIFGLGLQEGQQEGRQAEAASLTLRLLQRRFGALSADQGARIQALTLSQLEALAEALPAAA